MQKLPKSVVIGLFMGSIKAMDWEKYEVEREQNARCFYDHFRKDQSKGMNEAEYRQNVEYLLQPQQLEDGLYFKEFNSNDTNKDGELSWDEYNNTYIAQDF